MSHVKPLANALSALEKTMELQKATVATAMQTTAQALRSLQDVEKGMNASALDKIVMDQHIRQQVEQSIAEAKIDQEITICMERMKNEQKSFIVNEMTG